jgi:hypothetical protein
VALSALCLASGCGADDNPQAASGAGGATGASSTGSGLPGDKGEPCMQDSDCAAPDAKCRKGDMCTGSLGGEAFETECTAATEWNCAGIACTEFPANAQNKTGICTLPCDIDEDCGPGGACVDLGGSNLYCRSVCAVDADCANGFVCVDNPTGTGKSCFVVP